VSLHDPFLFTRIGRELLAHLASLDPAAADPSAARLGRVVAITSTRPGEGKTFVSQGLARALAEQQGGDVVWVDASFDQPASDDDASRRGAAGFSEIMTVGSLQGLAPASAGPERLWRLGRGVLAQGSLLSRPSAVQQGLFALRAGFALAVLDAPCFTACGSLLQEADAVVVVVDARTTPRQAAQGAIDQANLPAGRLAGVVLNHRPRTLPRWLGGENPDGSNVERGSGGRR
jgi:Mrp family chromosome partitioning ATPase